VLTNEHVVHRLRQVDVVLADGQVCPAEMVGADPRSDLAVLRIQADDLQPAELGGVDQVRRGHWTLAMGNALGLATDGQASFSYGVVSAIGRVLPQLGRAQDRYYGNLIQSTVQIHQGNSGGPLFDMNGRVIGVNTAIGIATDLGISVGFSIPLDRRAMTIIEKLIAGEPVDYGYLGAQVPMDGLADRDEEGALISDVVPGEPADEAGIQPQDVVLIFDGQPVRDEDHLIRLVGATEVGRVVPVTLRRNGRQMTVELKVGRRPAPLIGAQARMHWRGTVLADLTPERCDRLGLPSSTEGVLILEVRGDSPADAAGLQADQVIQRIGPHEIRSLLDFADFAERWSDPMPIGVLGRDEPVLVPPD
jgi:serine protease Do